MQTGFAGMGEGVDKDCQGDKITAMATMNISLPDHMKSSVEARAKGGQYSNVSDYVRDLIRKDLERQQAIGELQGLIDEGLRSGKPRAVDMAGFIERKTRGQGG